MRLFLRVDYKGVHSVKLPVEGKSDTPRLPFDPL